MKATYQWDSASTSCLCGMPILRAREVIAVFPELPPPGTTGLGSCPYGAMSTSPQIHRRRIAADTRISRLKTSTAGVRFMDFL
jgi:hypothetical protein